MARILSRCVQSGFEPREKRQIIIDRYLVRVQQQFAQVRAQDLKNYFGVCLAKNDGLAGKYSHLVSLRVLPS